MTKLRVAVLISGGGTTLANLLEWKKSRELPVEFGLVISSNKSAKGLEFARGAGIQTQVYRRKDFSSPQTHSDAIFEQCRAQSINLVVMGGYLEHLLIPGDFENRVINIHPSLIPSFSGKGYYGLRVHKAVIEYGVKVTGCTVHFVDNEFDHGPIIAQRTCAVFESDTPESLQARVFELERQIFPETIAAIARGKVSVHDRTVKVQTIL